MLETKPWDVSGSLVTQARIKAYLQAALDTGDMEVIYRAVRAVCRIGLVQRSQDEAQAGD